MTETTETIICPACNLKQVAIVKQTVPWETYIHVCKGCGYIIGESEWNVVKSNNMTETAEEFLREKYNADSHSFQDVVEHLNEFAKQAVDNATKELSQPKGSAKKVFNKFWQKVKEDSCDRRTLASISFDAGHLLRHEDNLAKKQLDAFSRLDMLDLIQSLKDYTLESHVILGHDEREPEDFLQTWEADQNHP